MRSCTTPLYSKSLSSNKKSREESLKEINTALMSFIRMLPRRKPPLNLLMKSSWALNSPSKSGKPSVVIENRKIYQREAQNGEMARREAVELQIIKTGQKSRKPWVGIRDSQLWGFLHCCISTFRNWRIFKSLGGLGDPYLSFNSLDTRNRSFSFLSNRRLRSFSSCINT